MKVWRCLAVLLPTALIACGPPPPDTTPNSWMPTRGAAGDPLQLERSGTLRQDQISVTLNAGPLRIEVTPLLPWVLEAAAPDTQARLTRIAEGHREAMSAGRGRSDPLLVLVTLSAREPEAEFRPNDLHLVARGLRERPLDIRGISPEWGTGRVGLQRTAVAVYAFPGTMDLTRDLTVEYGRYSDASWSTIVPRIEAERGRTPGPLELRGRTHRPSRPFLSPRARTS